MKPIHVIAPLAIISLAINIGLILRSTEPDSLPTATPPSAPSHIENPRSKTALPAGDLLAYAALGSYVAASNRIPDLAWTDDQFNAFAAGLRACYEGNPVPFNASAERLRDDINATVRDILGETDSGGDPLALYFAQLRAEENVQQTDSGLHYRITDAGYGDAPVADSSVLISYAGRLPDGQKLTSFQATRIAVKLADVLPGLREGLTLMQPAGKALLYLPPALSFADGRWPADIPRGAPIILFVELHDVTAR